MAEACADAKCVLLGGETAEMPGVYCPGEFDVAGTMVGVAEKKRLLPRPDLQAGDLLLGLASSGLHTNGYSLVRKIFRGLPLEATPAGLDTTLGDALLATAPLLSRVAAPRLGPRVGQSTCPSDRRGVFDNLPRVLPDDRAADIERAAWPVSPLFHSSRR